MMYKFILRFIVLIGLIEGLQAEQLSFSGGYSGGTSIFNDTVGYAIMVGSNPIQVVQLTDRGVVSHLGIWSTDGTLVAGVTNSPAASGSWNITPITLAANTEYILGSVNIEQGHSETSYGGLSSVLNADVSLVGSARNYNQFVFSIPTVSSGDQSALVGPTISFNILTPNSNFNGFIFSTNNNSASILSYNGSNNEISIPSTIAGASVKSIGSNAFLNNINLKSVIIPSGVTSIGDSAFSGCSSLTNIVIPNSVTSIGAYAFSGCPALTAISIPDSVVSFGGNIFWVSPNVIVSGSQNLIHYLSQNSDSLGFAGNAQNYIDYGGSAAVSYNLTENWLLNDSSFINALATIFFVPPIALVSLSNSISNLATETSPTNGVFVSKIATNSNFISALTTNTSFLSSLSSNLVSGSNVYGIATAGQLQTLSTTLSNTTSVQNTQASGFSNAISNSLVTIGAVSNSLTTSLNAGQSTLSNALSGVISSKITGLSNSLNSSFSTQITTVSNNIISSVAAQTTGISNGLAASISQQGTTLNTAITSISNSLSANFSLIFSVSNSLSSAISNLNSNLNNEITTNSAQLISISNNLSSAISVLTTSLSNSIAIASSQNAIVSNAVVSLAAQTATTNEAFIRAVAEQIMKGSNNYGLAIKQNQTLTFPVIPPVTYALNKTIKLSTTSSARLNPVTYTTDNPIVATVSNNILLIQGVGTTTITASQAGNPLYNNVSATQTLTVLPRRSR